MANADIAIVQVMAAHTYGWRGYFAVHPWIIYKRAGETSYTRYDVVGWGGGNVVRKNYALPDGLWFGSEPQILADHRGEGVDDLIDQIEAAIKDYPYPDQYRSYPGPNSNTFVAHIGRSVPTLILICRPTRLARISVRSPIQSDCHPVVRVFRPIFGLLGFSIGLEEGIELNLLGLNLGIDFNRPALRLPSVGRLGMDNVAPVGDVETVKAAEAEEAAEADGAGTPAY